MNRHLIKLIRPNQWLKNAFVFTPLFFGRQVADWYYAWPCALAFMAFCLAASGIYCFNDICDAEADRRHPVKRTRPVACGAVSKRTACVTMGMAWLMAFLVLNTKTSCPRMLIAHHSHYVAIADHTQLRIL